MAEVSLVKMPSDESHWISLIISQHWCLQATSHYLSQCWPRFMSPYGTTRPQWVNSSRPIFIFFLNTSCTWHGFKFLRTCEIALVWIPQNIFHDKSTLVKVWCCQTTSHYLSQCWSRSKLPYGVTRCPGHSELILVVQTYEVPIHMIMSGMSSWMYLTDTCSNLKLPANMPTYNQLERLRSEDTPRRPMITHTIDQFILNPKSILLTSSYRIPSQNKVKAKKLEKFAKNLNFRILL